MNMRQIALSSFLAAALAAPAAFAADDKVVVKVNGHDITASEVQLAAEDIMPKLGELPPNLRYPFIVEYLMERHLLAQAAVKAGTADTDEYKKRLAFYQAKALRDAYFTDMVKPKITDDMVKSAYDKEASKVTTAERVRARHILVASEDEADEVLARLKKGEKFEDVAKQASLDGSKEYGGDLGYFTAEEMVGEFSKAAFALKPGQISKPVKTNYGWHIIKLEDRKPGGAQPFEQVQAGIRAILLRQEVQKEVNGLRQAATIEIVDPDLKKLQEEALKKAEEAKKNGKTDLQAPAQ
ncbi:MAG: peptidyl-prolyl cis-trans isomerase [Aestuariivirgaceae bacterium]|nr:peptidyl-prolyl cis-trans isomerase [Aestuariivirgaceae bacterium]